MLSLCSLTALYLLLQALGEQIRTDLPRGPQHTLRSLEVHRARKDCSQPARRRDGSNIKYKYIL